MSRYEKSDPVDAEENRGFSFENEAKKSNIKIQEVIVLDPHQNKKNTQFRLILRALRYSFQFTIKISLLLAFLYGAYLLDLHQVISRFMQKQFFVAVESGMQDFHSKFQELVSSEASKGALIQKKIENPSSRVSAVWVYNPSGLDDEDKKQMAQIELATVPAANLILLNNKKVVNVKNELLQAPMEKLYLEPGEYDVVLQNTSLGVYSLKHVKLDAKQNVKLDFTLTEKY